MVSSESPRTVLEAIIKVLEDEPRRQATLSQLYEKVPALLGKHVSGDTIRGIINRSLSSRKKEGPYPILFVKTANNTYAFAKNKD